MATDGAHLRSRCRSRPNHPSPFSASATVFWAFAPAVVHAARGSGYTYTDPAAFGGFWEEESTLEAQRPIGACKCDRSSEVAWGSFKAELRDNLASDPSFSGAWVHVLCGSSYATIFRLAALNPETGRLAVRGTECTAGLAAMAAVCAQSAVLRSQGPSSPWHWHNSVVRDEGESVGDIVGQVPLGECMRLCEETEACGSFAHGPQGCHLKGRCSGSGDALVAAGQGAEGYRTYFLEPCPLRAGPQVVEASSGPGDLEEADDPAALLGEVVLLLDMALHLAERSTHCLDHSGWSFSCAELVANRVQLAEVVLGAGGAAGAKAELGAFRWSRLSVAFAWPASGGYLDGAVQRALERARIRWARRLNSEVGFWHILLSPTTDEDGSSALRSEEDAAAAKHWVDRGEVRWTWDGNAALCDLIAESRARVGGRHGPPRILNAGSGPLAPGPEDCSHGSSASLGSVPVVASDGLARFYLRVFDDLQVRPPRVPAHCPVEELHLCFPRNHFDVVHIRNALDHAMDPLVGLRQMLHVARPGGRVLLRHARNEGSPGQFQVGLHQWSFDAVPATVGGAPHFVVWSPVLRADATRWLLEEGLAEEVLTELRPHPGNPASGAAGDYIWVDIRKPV